MHSHMDEFISFTVLSVFFYGAKNREAGTLQDETREYIKTVYAVYITAGDGQTQL